MRPLLLPLFTLLILPLHSVLRTFHPRLENTPRIRQILHNNEPRIHHRNTIAVTKIAIRVQRIARHGEGRVMCDVPTIKKPFEGEVQVSDRSIGIEEDEEFGVVGAEEVGHTVDFWPSFCVAGDGDGAVVLVGVVVYRCYTSFSQCPKCANVEA